MNKFYYLFTICLLAFALSSCEKQSEEDNKSSLEEQELISKAIDFYEYNFSQECETKTFSNKKEKNKRINFRKDLDWDNAIVKKFLNGSLAVKVPVKFRENIYLDSLHSYMPLSDLTYVLIFKDESDCHVLEIVTTFPDPDYLKNTDENKKFKGVVYVESWDGEFLQSISYNNLGIFVNYNDYSQNETSLKTSSAICISPIDYYSCWKKGPEDMTWNCSYVGTGTVSEYCESSGGGDPEKPDSNTADKYKPSGGPSGTPDPKDPKPEIIDSLMVGSCADEVYKSFIKFDNTVSLILNRTFGVSGDFHITFTGADLPKGKDGNFDFADGPQTYDAAGALTSASFNISISNYVLNNSTMEYIAVTYAHEAIHALITYYEINDPEKGKELFPVFYESMDFEDGEHLTMGNLYIDELVNIIMQINPNMPISDATCLAWGGLQDTRAYDLKKLEYDQINGSTGAWDLLMTIVNQRERESELNANGTICKDDVR